MAEPIIQRGDVWFMNKKVKGVFLRNTLKTTDKKEALKRANALIEAVLLGNYVKQDDKVAEKTLDDAFKDAWAIHWSLPDTKDQDGVKGRYKTLTRFIPADTPVSKINQNALKGLVKSMREAVYYRSLDSEGRPKAGAKSYPYEGATINRVLQLVGTILELVTGDEGYEVQTVSIKKLKLKETTRTRYLTSSEVRTMFEALRLSPNPHHARCLRLFQFLLATGNRMGEALKLQWPHLNLTTGRMILKDTKSGDDVRKPLPGPAVAVLQEEFMEGYKKPFEGIGETMYRNAWDYAKREAGLGHDVEIVRHTLRHTCASWLLQNGVPLEEVSKFLGHKSVKTTEKCYAHTDEKFLVGAANTMNSVYSVCGTVVKSTPIHPPVEKQDCFEINNLTQTDRYVPGLLIRRSLVRAQVGEPSSISDSVEVNTNIES